MLVFENYSSYYSSELNAAVAVAVAYATDSVLHVKVLYETVDINLSGESGALSTYLLRTVYTNQNVSGITGLRYPACTALPRVGNHDNIAVTTHSCECSLPETTYIHVFPCANDVGIAVAAVMKGLSWSRAIIVAFDTIEQDYGFAIQEGMISKYNALDVEIVVFNSTDPMVIKLLILSYKDSTTGKEQMQLP